MQLQKLKSLVANPIGEDEILQFCLDNAGDIICDIRNSDKVENVYLNRQISIAIEIYNKRGAEGQVGHDENGLVRIYEKGDVSDTVINKITPVAKTPFSKIRVIE